MQGVLLGDLPSACARAAALTAAGDNTGSHERHIGVGGASLSEALQASFSFEISQRSTNIVKNSTGTSAVLDDSNLNADVVADAMGETGMDGMEIPSSSSVGNSSLLLLNSSSDASRSSGRPSPDKLSNNLWLFSSAESVKALADGVACGVTCVERPESSARRSKSGRFKLITRFAGARPSVGTANVFSTQRALEDVAATLLPATGFLAINAFAWDARLLAMIALIADEEYSPFDGREPLAL